MDECCADGHAEEKLRAIQVIQHDGSWAILNKGNRISQMGEGDIGLEEEELMVAEAFLLEHQNKML